MDAVSGRGDAVALTPPPWRYTLTEVPRGAAGVARLAAAYPSLRQAPRGRGQPVMLLPGLFNSDRSNVALWRYLASLGYAVEGWGLGRNLGQRAIGHDGARLFARVEAMAVRHGAPVTLVGVSLGGLMARIAAQRMPDLVARVVTISSPFAGPPTATRVWRAYQALSGARVEDPAVRALVEEAARPLPVPITAIWSASDGLVGGAICRGEDCDAVEVRSSHIWVQFNPEVWRAVAMALASRV
ncbi:esterase/lipase family protein [Sphingomonas sp. Y38-1Y]|uniref:esterase/lipase family protein n=1 Tax=Sphingomonas sp. Y38-1Y TaxID=3078265 RepID=UPI0028E9FFB6|nr:alpha/beta fold hydrolase [Sphingomonas sp. Y38-1Y]